MERGKWDKHMNTYPQSKTKLASIGIAVFVLLLLTAPGILAQTNVDFFCNLAAGSACTGTVVQSGSNYSSSGISTFNDSGPFGVTVPFMLAFDTATGTISIDGTGIFAGQDLVGHIISFSNTTGLTSSGFLFIAVWPSLPSAVQTFMGSLGGVDMGFVIYTSSSRNAQSVDVLISPTPEPTGMLLMGTGLLAIGGLLRKRLQRRSASF
jgi:hypothetical protein